MAKTKQKTGRSTGSAGLIVLALLCSLLCAAGIYFYLDYDKVVANVNENTVLLDDIKVQLSQKEEEASKFNEEAAALEDLDTKIVQIRETFFKNAVRAEELARSGEADFKVCYLTFDDGPYKDTTPLFLDVLEEYDVQATFFCLAKEGYDDIYKREKMNCHSIGNHTASHNISYIYSSIDAFMNDLLENRQFIEDLLGITTDVMRFPGGSPQVSYSGLNKTAMVARLKEAHYGYVDWTLTTGDGGGPYYLSPDEFLHNVVDLSPNYNVISVLMHDYSNNTLACLPEMIEILSDQGFIFLPLSYDAPIVRKGD